MTAHVPTSTAPPQPPASPRIYNISGTWRHERPGAAVMMITGGTSSYSVTGTDGRYKNQGTISGDGTKFESRFKDVPGFCCGGEGYAWLEVIDANTFRERSMWWSPGQGSKEKPQLTYGWSTWKRSSPSGTVKPEGKSGGEGDLETRKKALGPELDEVRKAGNWSADHHYQVGTFIGNSRTSAQLNAVETLMHEYAGCYQTLNAERAKVADAQKAGRYRTPGDRIGALNQAQSAFNQCVGAAHSRYVAVRNR